MSPLSKARRFCQLVIEAPDLKNVTLVGHFTGRGEVARYIGRHGSKRVAGAVLIAAVFPIVVKVAANSSGFRAIKAARNR